MGLGGGVLLSVIKILKEVSYTHIDNTFKDSKSKKNILHVGISLLSFLKLGVYKIKL